MFNIDTYNEISQKIKLLGKKTQIIAVSKNHSKVAVEQAISHGVKIFGENRVQEAQKRWENRKHHFPELCLHLIGPLQSNKAADAVRLFDVIHTIDRPKIAAAIAKEAAQQNKNIQCFIQVNTGDEPQKSGISPRDLSSFVDFCREEAGLPISGLMCIPPVDEEAAIHFGFLNTLASRNNLTGLSMGMSGDYEEAIRFGATHIRVGSALFGSRE